MSATIASPPPNQMRPQKKAGNYYRIETLRSTDGTVIHRGLCGAPNETTTVTTVAARRRLRSCLRYWRSPERVTG